MAAVAEKHCPENEGLNQESLDPRIQTELEKLNKASDDINRLELELDEARAGFRQVLTESTQKLNTLAKKCGSCIDKARPYYDARIRAKEAQILTQNAAYRYDRACSQLGAAKEMVNLAEQGFFKKGQPFDPAWQEMLNHATMKVNDAEQERLESEIEHRQTASYFNEAEQRVKQIQKDLKRAIAKSRPYFELKARVNQQMEEQKKRVGMLESTVNTAKITYSEALRSLETISDEIHQQRSEAKMRQELGTRGSGVGAEAPAPPPPSERDMKLQAEKNADTGSPTTVQTSPSRENSPLRFIDTDTPDRHKTPDASIPTVEYRRLPNPTSISRRRPLTMHTSVSAPLTEPEFQIPDVPVPEFVKPLPKSGSYHGADSSSSTHAITTAHPTFVSRSVSDKSADRVSKVPLLRVQLSTPCSDNKSIAPEFVTSPDETQQQASTFRTNAAVMESVQRAKILNRPFLRPNRSRDSLLDETSDTESLTGSLASVSMLDDDQIESLMLETGEYMKFLAKMDEAKKAKWKRMSLPGKLNYLEEYIDSHPDWLAEYRLQQEHPESDEVFIQDGEGAVGGYSGPKVEEEDVHHVCSVVDAAGRPQI